MKPRKNESFEDFLARFTKSSQPIIKEAVARRRFVPNSERKRKARRAARRRWERKRRWLKWKQWRSDKFDDVRRENR